MRTFNWRFVAVLMTLLVLWLGITKAAFGETDVATGVKNSARFIYHQQKKHHFTKGAVLSSGECIAGIAFSRNPAGAAAVGLPVLFVGNLTAYFLRDTHPKISGFVQGVSGTFCLSYGLTRSGRVKPSTVRTKPPTGGSGDPGNPGSGGNPGDGGNPGNGGGGNPGSGGCQQDCGLPGNGGINGGHDTNKPPFPGRPHRPGA